MKLVVDKESLVSVADAIREKGGTSESLEFPNGFVDAVNSIESGEDDFVGIKYSNYSNDYLNIPKTADARSLDKQPNGVTSRMLQDTFKNSNANANGGYFACLEEVYLPEIATAFINTFENCTRLTTIHGGLSNIIDIDAAFKKCFSLDINAIIARMTSLKTIGTNSFYGCTQATEITFPATVKSIHSGAFNGCTNVTDVYCPWAEGAVANAPWGMSNATIHYNSEV